jgi:signal transduction histidine kinase/ActR/RegA family two-component response regulator
MEPPATELFQQVCREIGSLVPCDRISVALAAPGAGRFVVVTVHPENGGSPTWDFPLEESCAALVLKRRRAEFLSDIGTEFRWPEEEILHRQGIRDAAFLPLLIGGAPYGVLILGSKEPHSLEGRGVRFLERAGGLIATAIAASRWDSPALVTAVEGSPVGERPDAPLNGLRRAFRQMVAFSRVSNRIVQEDDLDTACRLFLETIRDHSGYRRAVLTLLDAEGRERQWYFTGLGDDDIDSFHSHKMTPAQREQIFQPRFQTGNSYLVPASSGIAIGGLRPAPAEGRGKTAAGDLLFIPLHGAGQSIVGTVMLDDPVRPEAPTAETLSSLELFASTMAHAVEKKHLDQEVKMTQARLRVAQDQLLQAEKLSSIGQLISGVTHELNNPLAGIMGFSQLLLKAEMNPKARKNLERIHQEAVRCQKIVQTLLTFSRRHKPEKSSQSLNEVIDGVIELRAYQLQVDDVAVIRRYDRSLPRTLLDIHQIQQVVLNLVNNAHHAMMQVGDRPRRLTIVTEREGGLVRARFIDTGPGIPRDRLEKIFDAFFTTKGPGKGTGLGLNLSRAIVKDHQGTLTADSSLGDGATITLDLPLVDAPSPEKHKAVKEPRVAAPLRLLVVDDEEVLCEVLADFLTSVGHVVETARDGRKALEIAKGKDFDVILTDLKMPGLDGQGLYEQLTKVKPQMAPRFIFSTGDLANARTQSFFQKTGCLYLSKPFKLEAVLATIDQLSARLRAA